MRINKLQVPKVIRHGAPVVLDCDFTIDETDQELVVKWFFNKNKTLVYQWIPGKWLTLYIVTTLADEKAITSIHTFYEGSSNFDVY